MRRATFDLLASSVGALIAVAGGVMLFLVAIGFWHTRHPPAEAELADLGSRR